MNMRLLRMAPAQWPHTPLLPAMTAVTATLLSAIVAAGLVGYRINLTPSEPLGLWRIVKLDRAAGRRSSVTIRSSSTIVIRWRMVSRSSRRAWSGEAFDEIRQA
ncbi:hypothetical protein [Rhizobium tropici]|uniref:hypothetical protein n=1 Tax=Rhizobium tropici TaxID=398 RepID=UPI003D7C1C0B